MGTPGRTQLDPPAQGGTVGLALSGGAVLGCCQIGVLLALDEAGIKVTHLAGTSIGALVADSLRDTHDAYQCSWFDARLRRS